ncbi:hypothetical protein GCM10023231_02730 [Olivibacter ginsenosidimutans]|uniref:Uncharacterized protein n=1 Tax=Olivibacter ginsenosidimutans TaxID=1176537 RepID=A0ABP9ADR2_9SPHI
MESSKKEKIYVNTLNWGVTDDHQISAISLNADKVRDRSDTVGSVKGLDPFVYRFKDDTLTLYFDGEVNYRLLDKMKTVFVRYQTLDKGKYRTVYAKAINRIDGYSTVPPRKDVDYPSDMPLPKER